VRSVLALAVLLLPVAASAHEVLHEVERGRAVAVRAYYADGEPLAYVGYDVFGPADPAVAHQRGRTDRQGWVAFVPDSPGAWRVRIADDTGHGLDVSVEVTEDGAGSGSGTDAVAFVLRPLLGLAVLGAIFGALYLRRRRAGTLPPDRMS
jgi:nickel transport protein